MKKLLIMLLLMCYAKTSSMMLEFKDNELPKVATGKQKPRLQDIKLTEIVELSAQLPDYKGPDYSPWKKTNNPRSLIQQCINTITNNQDKVVMSHVPLLPHTLQDDIQNHINAHKLANLIITFCNTFKQPPFILFKELTQAILCGACPTEIQLQSTLEKLHKNHPCNTTDSAHCYHTCRAMVLPTLQNPQWTVAHFFRHGG